MTQRCLAFVLTRTPSCKSVMRRVPIPVMTQCREAVLAEPSDKDTEKFGFLGPEGGMHDGGCNQLVLQLVEAAQWLAPCCLCQ